MIFEIFQIDAFTNTLFGGNPAAVCLLKEWLPDTTLLHIAQENNLAETAYVVHEKDNTFKLRWFTPEIEIDLCGHATLATAFVIFNLLNFDNDVIFFKTMSGDLEVKVDHGFIEMRFPSRPPEKAALPQTIANALSKQPKEVYKARDYILMYPCEEDIQQLKVDASILANIDLNLGGICVTAKGNNTDFVSRFFTPGAAIFEDPVTGSAHCSLVPLWTKYLKKDIFHARQISKRQGELFCQLINDIVLIKGQAVKYSQGCIEI